MVAAELDKLKSTFSLTHSVESTSFRTGQGLIFSRAVLEGQTILDKEHIPVQFSQTQRSVRYSSCIRVAATGHSATHAAD